jgi:hypothetical protein
MRTPLTAEIITCAICERTLLLGERTTRYSPHGDAQYVDVCALCQDVALEHGWVKEGSPTTPALRSERRRRGLLAALFEPRRAPQPEVVVAEPILRRLSAREQALVEAAELFNASPYRRTVAGIARSLGDPSVSMVSLSSVSREIVVTVAWDISWYQYRVAADGPQPVRLAERGMELDDLEPTFKEWNAHLGADGRVLPDVARV